MSAKQEHPRRRSRLAALAMAGALIGCGAAAVVATAGLPAPLRTPAYADGPDGPQKVFTISDQRIAESSGLTFGTKHTDALYTINDSGNTPDVFALDLTGKVLGTIALGGATNTDWEAVASGPDGRIWVGDIGDNDRKRESITLFRIHEPDQLGDQREQWSRFTLAYPDGAHDAETLLVHPKTGRVYIVTKDPQGGGIYAGPAELASGTPNTMTKVANAPAVVTDGAFLPDGSAAVVRTYGKAYVLDMPSGKVQRTVGLPTQRQGESL
ncbi:MAG TPA: hypothetical protein VE287_07620, partial [Actinopolymorphaceae bacterium]|nr:hypothetical protein [Actinopolymorphaceae bacterium]